jgi:hypothetical protein
MRSLRMVRGVGVTVIAGACALASTSPRNAKADQVPHFGAQRTLGLGPVLGIQGTGATVGAQLDLVGLWLTGGYAPILVFGNKHDALRSLTFDFYSSGQVNADVSIMVYHPKPTVDVGLLLGYRYNTVLAHGIGIGGIAILDFSRSLAGFVLVEPEIFPNAQSQLTSAGYPSDRDAAIPVLQGGTSIGLLFYP